MTQGDIMIEYIISCFAIYLKVFIAGFIIAAFIKLGDLLIGWFLVKKNN